MGYSKVIAGVIVLAVISFLIIQGPANAFIGDIISSATSVERGTIVSFNASLKPEEGESLKNIDHLSFQLKSIKDDTNILCDFTLNGKEIEGCNGIKIKDIKPDFGYCEGYGYGSKCELKYEITLDTNKYEPNEFETSFNIISESGEKTIQGENLLITQINDKACSVRSKGGTLTVNDLEFKNSRINFYIPFKKATGGEGYITGQNKKGRFSYKFSVEKMTENSDSKIRAVVTGNYRLGFTRTVFERAILTFDKKTGEITVVGDKIKFSDGDIYFRHGC